MEEPRNGSRYVTWAQYGQDRERDRNIYASQGDLVEARDGLMSHVTSLERRADANSGRIDELHRQLTAAPEGDKPGGLIWQMNELRREQKTLVRNLAVVVMAATFVWNLIAPYIGELLRNVLGVPRP